jgi:phage gp46-like protein
MQLFLNGAQVSADMTDSLSRAVVISLFTWQRASQSDEIDNDQRMGWWGDTFAENKGDKIGSKLWLLLRQKVTDETLNRAQEYAYDALKWLIDDGICSDITVNVERDEDDPNRINLDVQLTTSTSNLTYKIKDVLNGNS